MYAWMTPLSPCGNAPTARADVRGGNDFIITTEMKLYAHSCDSRFPLTHVATIADDGSDTLGVGVFRCRNFV